MSTFTVLLLAILISAIAAFTPARLRFHGRSYQCMAIKEKSNIFQFEVAKKLGQIASSVAIISSFVATANAELKLAPWNDKILYEVIQDSPNGATPKVGDLVAIRFRATYQDNVIDDTFKTADPYYVRCGVGSVVPGLDEALVHMREGEKAHFQFGGDLAFGSKGIKSAPGRARVPPNAIIDYEILLEKLPGTGDEFIADFEE
jgi:FKBP-type peptidyl-prolyl cis-trans isomerase